MREGFEAALIIGLILAYLQKTGNLREHAREVWMGVSLGIAFSAVIGAVLFATVGEVEGTAEALYEGFGMLLAAGVVTWMVFWMRRQAATIGSHLREQVSESLRFGGGAALVFVAFVGVAREGVETALFLFASTEESTPVVAVTAASLGLAAAVALGIAFYRGALRLDLRKFFTVTGVLVILFAAWLVFNGLHELGEAGGGEVLEAIGPVAAVLYGVGLTWIYLRGLRRAEAPPAPRAAEATAQP